jgi:hypothetical protein
MSEPLPAQEQWHGSKKWSFLSSGKQYAYCPFDYHSEFDGTIDGLSLPWSQRRRDAIDGGDELTPTEFRQWQRGRAEATEVGDACAAFIVAVAGVLGLPAEMGVAVFVGDPGDAAEDTPWLDGVYATVSDAEAALGKRGVLRPMQQGVS